MKPWGKGKPYAKVTDKAGYVRIFIPASDPFCRHHARWHDGQKLWWIERRGK